MNLFNVYPLFDITPVKATDVFVFDENDNKYLDLYGGHAVISIGHSHPTYVQNISEQVNKLGFYSNSIQNPLQVKLAKQLTEFSDCKDYQLFLCNSGAEANENALKLASFHTQKKKVILVMKEKGCCLKSNLIRQYQTYSNCFQATPEYLALVVMKSALLQKAFLLLRGLSYGSHHTRYINRLQTAILRPLGKPLLQWRYPNRESVGGLNFDAVKCSCLLLSNL